MTLKSKVRTIADFPKKGIMFRDVTTLMKDPEGLKRCIDDIAALYESKGIEVVAGIEARGFILGAVVAYKLGVGFVPIRKKGRLPGKVYSEEYTLEYGVDTIEVHTDAIEQGQRVLLIDDLLATGGTCLGAANLIKKSGGKTVEACFLVDLPDLGGGKKLKEAGIEYQALMEFEGE